MNALQVSTTLCCAPPSGPPAQAIFPKGPDAPASARLYVRDVLVHDDEPLGESQLDDVLLIVSELVTNAYRYGTEPGDSILVTVLTTTELVRVEVHDPCRTFPRIRVESGERARGRGLNLVDGLALRWGVDERPMGKAVWVEVAR
ncbi:ATP-binding protein [Streptomyces venezuelae]|uniref:ATP-binding protein n=1 Tax=Streptomyces sp. B6(2022) TaxID=3404749 RepID=UPI00311F4907